MRIDGGSAGGDEAVRLFLCGDVMTGRGIDQILPHPSEPRIYEAYMQSAVDYVRLAERRHGPIPRAVGFDYIWGDALGELQDFAPDLRIINLETAITRHDAYWPGKGINYRMHPRNIPCLKAAGIDGCALANNHVLDWGQDGLRETLQTLAKVGIGQAGAGRNAGQAEAPLPFELPGRGRVLLFALAHGSSGVPPAWRAGSERPGVALLDDLAQATARDWTRRITRLKQPGDLVVLSMHWGGNWGYRIAAEQRRFAHALIDGGVDVLHGHSSHHPKAIEIYRQRPIFYGCGDFINDYEGIGGYEAYRDDLTLMYFLDMAPGTGRLLKLTLVPMQIKRFRLNHPAPQDLKWIHAIMQRECARLGASVSLSDQGRFEVEAMQVNP